MKIEDIRLRMISLAKDSDPFDYMGLGHAVWALIEVLTDEGITGLSRTIVRRQGDDAVAIILRDLLPLLIGEDPRDVERLWWKQFEFGRQSGSAAKQALVTAIGALDIAFWDILGKSVDRPVWRLLGGMRNRVPVYADQITYPLGEGEEYRAVLEIVEQYRQEGYWTIKLHLPREEPTVAVRKVMETRRLLGDATVIPVDLMGLWDPWAAAQAAQGFEEANVYWLEDAFLWDDRPGGLGFVASRTSIPTAGGERDNTLQAWRDYVEIGRVKFLLPDIITGGGFSALKRAADFALAHHVKLVPHGASFPEFGAHLVAGIVNGDYQPLAPSSSPIQTWGRIYREPLVVKEGYAEMTERPGLGLEFDEDVVRRHQVDR